MICFSSSRGYISLHLAELSSNERHRGACHPDQAMVLQSVVDNSQSFVCWIHWAPYIVGSEMLWPCKLWSAPVLQILTYEKKNIQDNFRHLDRIMEEWGKNKTKHTLFQITQGRTLSPGIRISKIKDNPDTLHLECIK